VFGVDEGADAALLLGFGDGLQRKRRLARAFRAVDLDDTTRLSEPFDTVSISMTLSLPPSFMMEPLPKERSIWESAASSALLLSTALSSTSRKVFCAISSTFRLLKQDRQRSRR
jgi:hypothetical protein